MARIAGIDLPREKRIEIGLTYIYGIGATRAKEILAKTGIDADIRVKDLTDDQEAQLREVIEKQYLIEGDLRRSVAMNIKRLSEIGCYRGLRHRRVTVGPEGASGTVNVTILDADGNYVDSKNVTLSSGSASAEFTGLAYGEYNATVYYSGDAYYNASSSSAKFIVSKNASSVSVVPEDIFVGMTETVQVTTASDLPVLPRFWRPPVSTLISVLRI